MTRETAELDAADVHLAATVASHELAEQGFVRMRTSFATPGEAWTCAAGLVDGDATLEVIGEYVVPPADGPPSRDFQTLHVDFGLPLVPVVATDVARFTALHVPLSVPTVQAVTRLVPLAGLLGAKSWPDRPELLRRFAAYGASHGAWDIRAGYREGSLARIVEAASGAPPQLPSVRASTDFLCGTEFATLADEMRFFAARDVQLEGVTIEIALEPGQLLVFDNLALAHGRRGRRAPGELHQRIFGYRDVSVAGQTRLRDRWLEPVCRVPWFAHPG